MLRRLLSLPLFASALVAASISSAQTDGSLKWSFTTQGIVISSPAIAGDGTIYAGSESRRLFAINPNGTTKWRFPAGLISTVDFFDATPTVAGDGTIYAGNFDGTLYALNPNGTLKWAFPTGSYILSSVAIASDGTLYFGAGDGALHALNPDGTEKWSYQTGDWVDSSPAIGGDGTIYFGSWDFKIYALNPNGTLKWSVLTGNAVQSSPAIGGNGFIYIGSGDRKLYAIRPDGTVAWSLLTGDSVDGHPVVGPDDTVYFGSADGKFHAMRPDGTAAWAAPYNVIQGIYGGALIRADGTILFGASDKSLYALNADGTLKWRFSSGDLVDSSPAVAPDGTIYFGSYDGKIYALNGNASSLSTAPWPKFRRDARNLGRAPAGNGAVAPTITTHPLTQTVNFGDPVTFSVAATGTLPFTYEWQKNSVAISGANGSSYVIAQAVAADAASYRVVVTNSAGNATSNAATLTVNAPVAPAITVQPRPLILAPGARLSLWTNATGSAPLSYQWQKNNVAIAGATKNFHEIAAAAAGDAGSYTVVITNAGGSITSNAATVSLDAAASARLANLSTRAVVGTGDSILIPGFVVSGSVPRRLLVRAVGPTLALDPFGVAGTLADPMLTIYSGANPILANDNWGSAFNAVAIATTAATLFAFALPAGSADAAALVDLPPGSYTVQVSGIGATTGVSLVELYDAGAVGSGTGKLINVSARADVGTGDNVMIPGFVIEGTGAKTLLIRAVGPSLNVFGVQGFLADPVLHLFDGQNEILSNDNWPAVSDPVALTSAATAVSAFALENGSADAAMLVVLMPGTYTAQASGIGGTTGNVLVEVYEVQ